MEPTGNMETKQSHSSWPPLKLSLVAVIVSLGSGFNFGYQLLITNPAQEAFIQFLNSSLLDSGEVKDRATLESVWGFIVSLFFWGATFGSFFIQKTADVFGRKRGLIFTFFLQIIAVIIAIASFYRNCHLLYGLSRFLLGAALALSLGISPLFITECSPAACRGLISLATAIMLQAALVVGAIAAMPQLLGNQSDWWLLYLGELILTVVVTVACLYIKESPGYLVSRHRITEAEESIQFYHGVDAQLAKEEVELLEKENTGGESLGLFEVLKHPTSRRGTIIGSIVMAAMIMSGIAAINAFAFEILLSVGLNALQASIGNIIICLMTLLGVVFSSLLIERLGRRPLLLVNFAILAVINICIFIFMLAFQSTKNSLIGWGVVISICLFNFIFCVGPGPIAFFITGELVSQNGRGAACTWVNFSMNGVRSILLLVYFPLKAILGGPWSYFVLFFPPCLLVVIYLYFYLPETKGKTPEQAQAAYATLPQLRRRNTQEVHQQEELLPK